LAYWLAESTGARTYGFGSHPRPVETDAFDDDDDGDDTARDGGEDREHTDFDFAPDVAVRDGETFLTVDGWTLTGTHTPGHTSNHMCFHLDAENALFTGDHIMGWSTTVVSPPDGNMADYMASVRKLMSRSDAILYPTHGNPVSDPAPFLAAYLAHRVDRENQIVELLRRGPSTIRAMVEILYVDVRRELHKPARRSVLAHMLKLLGDGVVATVDNAPVSMRVEWVLRNRKVSKGSRINGERRH
jgi:glyoxylase-like metal-dependent hydrolase (beta-lactamase superfamily II)